LKSGLQLAYKPRNLAEKGRILNPPIQAKNGVFEGKNKDIKKEQ
jgi:hypothetical protein